MTALEQRLDDTEKALYDALAILRSSQSNDHTDTQQGSASISGRPANTTKSSRMEEWKSIPLKDANDIQRWWVVVGGDDRQPERKLHLPNDLQE